MMNTSPGLKIHRETAPDARLIMDVALFLIGSLLVFGVIDWGVPRFAAGGIDPLAAWMILSVLLVFMPISLGSLLLLRQEKNICPLRERLRLQRPSGKDWLWGLVGLLIMGIGSLAAFKICAALGLNSNPPFARQARPWSDGRQWMFILWAFYWPVNILGENLAWRGVILPRMENRLGKTAWLYNALLWGIFHLAFGWGNLIILLPTLLIVPYVAQKRGNTWLAVFLHACLSAPGFIALAFGLM